MDPEQLKLDFNSQLSPKEESGFVVRMSVYADAKRLRQQEAERARLFEAIVRSVEHIQGSSPDAEAM